MPCRSNVRYTPCVADDDATAWLLVTVSAGGSSTLRVHSWRKLRSLGAFYIQSSVCLLPKTRETTRATARLASRVRRDGGSCRILKIAITDAAEKEEIVDAFSAERSDEYHEICSRTPAFEQEIESERARGRATYTEVEESQADLERLQKWLRRVRERDYFQAAGRADAEAAVARCAQLLEAFEAEALAAEVADAPQEGATQRRLRAVGEP